MGETGGGCGRGQEAVLDIVGEADSERTGRGGAFGGRARGSRGDGDKVGSKESGRGQEAEG